MALSPNIERNVAELGLVEEEVFANVPAELLLDIEAVHPNAYNPKTCSDERLLRIAKSIKQLRWNASMLCMVWRDPDGQTEFTIVNGEHRYHICKFAGFKHYPAVVAPGGEKGIQTREDAMAWGMALEEATAGRDGQKWAKNLLALSASGKKDDFLKELLRVNDPAALRQRLRDNAPDKDAMRRKAKTQAARPRIMTLTFTEQQHAAYQEALGKARTRLKIASETNGMLDELAGSIDAGLTDEEIVAMAAIIRKPAKKKTRKKAAK